MFKKNNNNTLKILFFVNRLQKKLNYNLNLLLGNIEKKKKKKLIQLKEI